MDHKEESGDSMLSTQLDELATQILATRIQRVKKKKKKKILKTTY